MEMHANATDVPITYNSKFREYGIWVLNGGPVGILEAGSIVQVIAFCPWCGSKLPDSLRDSWFQRLDELKLEPFDPALPEEMKSGAWWKANI